MEFSEVIHDFAKSLINTQITLTEKFSDLAERELRICSLKPDIIQLKTILFSIKEKMEIMKYETTKN